MAEPLPRHYNVSEVAAYMEKASAEGEARGLERAALLAEALDVARAERDLLADALAAVSVEIAPELAALRALADAVEADGTLDKTREYLRRHGPIVSDYAPHLRPIPLALAAVRAAQGPR